MVEGGVEDHWTHLYTLYKNVDVINIVKERNKSWTIWTFFREYKTIKYAVLCSFSY